MWLFSLLESESQTAANPNDPSRIMFIVLLAVVVVGFGVWMFFSGKKSKQRQSEYLEQLNAIAPGHKVKTIGGICGIVVEVCDDNTVVIETGSEKSGKSFIKVDKELIGQTDAKGPTQIAREEAEAKRKAEKEGKKAEAPAPVKAAPAEEKAEPVAEEPAEAAPAAEETEEGSAE